MKHIGILVGTDADIPQTLAAEKDITVYPFVVTWEGVAGDMQNKEVLYHAMRQEKTTTAPKTSQPSPQTLKDIFEKQLQTHEQLIVFTISAQVSGCFNSAQQARLMLPESTQARVHLIDSQGSTGAEGLLAVYARELADTKHTAVQILQKLLQIQTILFGTFDDPSWAQKGGRLNGIQATLVRHMIEKGFRPILALKNGQLATHKIQMGAKDKVQALMAQLKDHVFPETSFTFAITHGDCASLAEQLQADIAKQYPHATCAYTNSLSAVIAAHIGPDSLVISLIET